MTSLSLQRQIAGLGISPHGARQASAGPGGDTEAPSVPQNLSATAVPPSQIDLTWDASTDNVAVTGYNIYRDNVLIDTSPTNAYSDSGLSVGTYEYEVSAFDAAANESARSAPDTATIPDTTAPSVPQNLNATAVSPSQIDLTWDASADNVAVTGYNIYRDNVLVDTSPTNSYSDTGLAPGTLYQYEVSAFDAVNNESARSTPASATTHQVIVAAGLIAEWRFDDGAGQTLTDASGHGHHGQLGSTAGADANDPAWATNPLRLQFDGVNDWVIVPAFAGPTAYHLDLVVKADPASASSAMLFVAHGLADGDAILQVFKNGSGSQLKYRTRHAAGTQNYVGSITVFDNAWHLVQLSHNGSQIVVHIDGNLDLPAQAVNPLPSSNGPIWLGARGAGGGQLFLKGAEAWAAWYSIGFDASQRAQNEAYARDLMAQRGVTLP
jgi:chitodextrinase